MAKVEIKYNPYIMETSVLFNDRKPFVNSRVEKYTHRKLQEWIDEVPEILFDEMNGYDFSIDFTGPKMDYEQLRKEFAKKGVIDIEGGVSIFHKNEYEDRHQKMQEIKELLKWLNNHPNKHFDFNLFRDTYTEIFDESYSFITIHMQGLNTDFLQDNDISIVDVDSAKELDGKLNEDPVFLFVDEKNYSLLPFELRTLKNISVKENQLFFLIKDTIATEKVKRVIQDLGIHDPHVVSSTSDKVVNEYFYAYPVNNRILKSVDVFNNAISEITNIISEEAEEYKSSDQSINSEIEDISRIIERIKKALDRMKSRDNIEAPSEIKTIKKKLTADIDQWKENRFKFNADSAAKFADNYNSYIKKKVREFVDNTNDAFIKTTTSEMIKYKKVYKASKCDGSILEQTFKPLGWGEEINLKTDLLNIREEKMVEPKKDIGELIFGSGKNKEKVKETTYYCNKWRNYAKYYVKPRMGSLIKKQYDQMLEITTVVANQYIEKLNSALKQEQQKKEDYISKLSKDALQLQADRDWLAHFKESVQTIQEVNYDEDDE